jgi:hypothetical protein
MSVTVPRLDIRITYYGLCMHFRFGEKYTDNVNFVISFKLFCFMFDNY